MHITIVTGLAALFDELMPHHFFEINEKRNPIHPYLISQKVRDYKREELEKPFPIYTQSEHVLNGFRIRLKNKTIDSLTIIYVKDNVVHNIEVNEDGSIDEEDWVEGLFDQTEKDFKELFGF